MDPLLLPSRTEKDSRRLCRRAGGSFDRASFWEKPEEMLRRGAVGDDNEGLRLVVKLLLSEEYLDDADVVLVLVGSRRVVGDGGGSV